MDDQSSLLEKLKLDQSKEKKEMQAKIAALKHTVTKNDKKNKKEVAARIELMEKELKERHSNQLNTLLQKKCSAIPDASEKDEQDSLKNSFASSAKENQKKPSKAQIRREKKVETLKRRAMAVEEDEKNARTSRGKTEMEEIKCILEARNPALKVFDIEPDGDCLYNALSHQANLKLIGEFTGKSLRKEAAKYIREHPDDFIPFLINEAGRMVNKAGIAEYCVNVENTSSEGGTWGGQPELRAISTSLKCRIEVIQSNGHVTHFGEEFPDEGRALVITYHKFAYSLGEHYNSTLLISVV